MVAKKPKPETTDTPAPTQGWGVPSTPVPEQAAGVEDLGNLVDTYVDPVTGEVLDTAPSPQEPPANNGADWQEQPAPAPTEPAPEKPKRSRAAKGAPDPQPGKTLEGDGGGNFSNAAKALITFVERVERLDEEIAGLKEDRSEVFAEAKALGYDVPIMREAIRRRGKDPEALKEHDSKLDLYEEALR